MKIDLSGMDVKLGGTLVVGQNISGNKTVTLIEDSKGNLGTIEVGLLGGLLGETKVITDNASGVSLNLSEEQQEALIKAGAAGATGEELELALAELEALEEEETLEETIMSEEETIQVVEEIKEVIVKAATKSEEKIERAVTKQLAAGTIPDANGDGVADLADVEAYKKELIGLNKSKLESIIEESKEDLSLLSEIIVNSESDQSMGLMEDLMEASAESAALLMSEIVEQEFDIFSHVAEAETGNFEALRETIVSEMIDNQSDYVADTMAQMMAVGSSEMSSYMINEITNVDPTATAGHMSMDVLASFTELAPEKMTAFYQSDPSMMDSLTTYAFENATQEDIGMISDMMQETPGGNTAYLMANMVEHNPEMIADVYHNLSEQNFDLFHHIETGRAENGFQMYGQPAYDPATGMPNTEMNPDYDPNIEGPAAGMTADPYYDPYAYEQQYITDGPMTVEDMRRVGEEAMYYQEQFFDDLKGEIFSEILMHSEGTASETAADMMMDLGGDSAMFMMENMMYENPEMMTQVMDNFMQEDFDVFYHMETTMDPMMMDPMAMTPGYDPVTGMPNTEMNPDYDPNIEGPAAGMTADPAMTGGYDMSMDAMRTLQGNVIGTMMDYGGEQAMETMAYMMSTGDGGHSAMILESVMEHTMMDPYMAGDMYYDDPYYDPYAYEQQYIMDPMMMDPGMGGEENMVLALLDEMAEVDPSMMADMYYQQEDLMNDMFDTAFASASIEDAHMIADIVASGVHGDMAEMMYDNLTNMDMGQDFMTEVFYDIAEQSPETLIAMAETEQALYETMAYDPYYDQGEMSSADLIQEIMMEVGFDDMGYGSGYDDPYYDPYMDPYSAMYDPYMDPYYDDPYMDPYYDDPYYDPYYADPYADPYYDPYSDPYSDLYDPYMMGGMYDPYMMGGMYDPYMWGGGYDPYFAGFGFGDPYSMYYDPYNPMGSMYYDPYMAGGMYYDPWMNYDDGIDSTYLGYSSYAAWCAATNCTYSINQGEPVWITPEGSIDYFAQQAYFPGSDVSFYLDAYSRNPGNLQYEITSGSLPPGLNLFSDGATIQGMITPADVLDTITFDGNTATFNLTKTAAPLVLDTIAFDGSTTYDLTKAGTPDTLDPIMGKTGSINSFNLYNNMMPFTPVNENYLTVTINGVTQTLDSDYTVSGAQIYFTTAPLMMDMVDITYTDRVAYTPAEAADLTVVIDGVTQNPSTYTITGSQIEFNAAKQAAFTDTLDTITFQDGVATYNLTKTGATTTIDTITFDGSDTYNLTTAGTPDTLDGISWAFNDMRTNFNLQNSMMPFTPGNNSYLTVTQNGAELVLDTDYTINGAQIVFTSAPYMGDTVDITYTDRVMYTPSDPTDVVVTVDGVAQTLNSDYTLSGSQIVFAAAQSAPSSNSLDTFTFDGSTTYDLTVTGSTTAIDTITFDGSDTYNLTTAGTPDALDPIGGFTGAMTNFNLYNDMMPFTPGNNNYLTVTQNGAELTLGYDYTISGAQIVFTTAPQMMDTVNVTYTDRVLYTPSDPTDVAVTVDGATQTLGSDYTISGSQIVFAAAQSAASSDTLDTITFDGSTTYDLTVTGATTTIDTITFDGSDTYNLTTAGTPDALDLLTGKTGYESTFNLRNDMMPFTPGNNNYLTVTQNGGELILGSDYTISNDEITFTYPPQMMDTIDITYTDRVLYTPSDPTDVAVTVDGVTQTLNSDYTLSGSQIVFAAAQSAPSSNSLDTITFDGSTTYDLTTTASTTTIDTITFDGSADPLNTIISNGTDTFSLTKDQTGATTTLDSISWEFNGGRTNFTLKQSMASYTPADPNNLTVTFNGSLQTLNSDYTISGDEITFYASPYPGDTLSMQYTTVVEVSVAPTATEILEVTVDGTPVPSSDYTVSGDEIIFNETIAASSQIDINHITGSTTYDLTTAGTPDALDPIGGFTGAMTNFNLYNDMMPFTPGNNNYLTVTQNGGELILGSDYTISGAQIVFTYAPLMMDTVDITYTDRVAYTPSDPTEVVVTVDGATQALGSDYTISGDEITFTEVKQDSVTMDSIAEIDVVAVTPAAAADLNIEIDGVTIPTSDYTIDGSTVVFNAPRSASETLDTLIHSTGATMDSIAETEVAAVTPAAAADLNIEIDGVTIPTSDYTIDGSTVVFNAPRSASETLDTLIHSTGATMDSIAETEVAAVTPAAAADLNIEIDGVAVPTSDYTIDGSTVVFNAPRSASETLDTLIHSTGATMDSIAETDVAAVTPAAAADLNIQIDGVAVPTSDYTVSGSTVVFDTVRSASESLDTLIHSGGDTLDSLVYTEVAAVTPAATGKLTVEIDNVLQPTNSYTVNGSQITFNEAKPASAVITALLHSEEQDYSFDITATDQVNQQYSQRTFSMFVNRPGIAWISPQRGDNTIDVPYNDFWGMGMADWQNVPLIAATSNKTDGMFNEVSLSITADPDTIANSGLIFDSGSFDAYMDGKVEGSVSGEPTSFGADTEFEITVKAKEVNNASYNNERTLIIKILEDTTYASPS
jgi:hypothetical protein